MDDFGAPSFDMTMRHGADPIFASTGAIFLAFEELVKLASLRGWLAKAKRQDLVAAGNA